MINFNKHPFIRIYFVFCLIIGVVIKGFAQNYFVPVDVPNRQSLYDIRLTKIGTFGLQRKARSTVPAHLHTGVDIMRPSSNMINEVILPCAKGVVISKRDDGPYAELILEHYIDGVKIWSLYGHLSGIAVQVGEWVEPTTILGRFMNKTELDRYGWHFNHLHFELLRIPPVSMPSLKHQPGRLFRSHSLVAYTKIDLDKYFYHPLLFLEQQFGK